MSQTPMSETVLIASLRWALTDRTRFDEYDGYSEIRDAIAGAWEFLKPETRVEVERLVMAECATRMHNSASPHGEPWYCDQLRWSAEKWRAWVAGLKAAM